MDAPRYGTPNLEYFASFFERGDPGGPMWALNLMKYREVADYADGRETTLSGEEADDVYMPYGPLEAVGAGIVFAGPVVHQLAGDDTTWDRIGVAQYPTRMAIVEMNSRKDFEELHVHKDAGMESTIVVASFPREGEPAPDPAVSGETGDALVLLQVVGDASTPDVVDGIDARRVGRFSIENVLIGDERRFAEARYDLISRGTADELVARGAVTDDPSGYAVIVDPSIDRIAPSLADDWSIRTVTLDSDLLAEVANPARVCLLADGSSFQGPVDLDLL
jgi:hypothetical protein